MPPSDAAGLLLGLTADHLFGDPARFHPVAGFGVAAASLEHLLWADSRPRGVLHVGLALLPVTALGLLGHRRTSGATRALAVASATATVVGGRSLRLAARRIEGALLAGDLEQARALLPWLCGRDAAGLDADGVARAVVESLAENTSDAVVAPLLWGAVAGLPGLLTYRAVNTLDAMVGHRSVRYARFGWAAARLDDVANLVPARVTAMLTVATAPLVGADAAGALRVWRRDARSHPSPNAGHCEAAFAGALGVRLGGPLAYSGSLQSRPTLGDGPPAGAAVVARATRLAAAVAWAGLAVSVGVAAARSRWHR